MPVIAAVATLLTLASSPAIVVPYVPQTDALCGGAAAAMVLRYWGEPHASAEDFAPLVDRRAGGIEARVLVSAVAAHGWRTERVGGSIESIQQRLDAGQPVIVLLADRRDRYHYVVFTIRRGDRRRQSGWRSSIGCGERRRHGRSSSFLLLLDCRARPCVQHTIPGQRISRRLSMPAISG
jgi:peptidase C39-like protein